MLHEVVHHFALHHYFSIVYADYYWESHRTLARLGSLWQGGEGCCVCVSTHTLAIFLNQFLGIIYSPARC